MDTPTTNLCRRCESSPDRKSACHYRQDRGEVGRFVIRTRAGGGPIVQREIVDGCLPYAYSRAEAYLQDACDEADSVTCLDWQGVVCFNDFRVGKKHFPSKDGVGPGGRERIAD
jgi:hypothetical protein